ncbi:MAG TPA: sodium transporter, partial [Spirochaetes bacterium]|nr:sodium transporter [Spirochaetota bacterium]
MEGRPVGPLNWAIVGLFILLILGLSFVIGRAQKNQEDYYLGGRKVPSWLVGTSLMSNQVSAISLIGAPAFIALKPGGGLIWLQYEMAIPLAMMVIIALLVPVYWKTGGVTIYEY